MHSIYSVHHAARAPFPAAAVPAATIHDQAVAHLRASLVPFIGTRQRRTLIDLIQISEERDYFAEKIIALKAQIDAMPTTGQTDGQGDSALVQLHYFGGPYDAWITERDMGDGTDDLSQHQAFGWASLQGFKDGELGYISIQEAIDSHVELDLYWEPKTLQALKAATV